MIRPLVVLLVLWCWCSHRQRCAAPAGWFVNGARGSTYELAPVLGRPEDDLLDAWIRRSLRGARPVRGQLYCTGGATLRQDGLSVWCQR